MRRKPLLVFLSAITTHLSIAQWTTSGSNIYNSNSGYVGIGTANPPYHLTVNGVFALQSSGVLKYHMAYLNGGFNIAESGVADYRLFIKDGGNIGIGTSSPANATLHVNTLVGNTAARFGSVNPLYIVADYPTLGFNTYYNAGYKYGTTNYAGTIEFNPTNGNFDFKTASSGTADAGAILTSKITILNNGNVGIGTMSPTFPLSIQGTIQGRGVGYFTQSSPINSLAIDASLSSLHKIYTNSSVDLAIGTNNSTTQLYLKSDGTVGIGTTNPQGYKFAVNGDAIFTKVKVKTYATWPDYVFHSSYKLPPLQDLENYIKQNNHLPDVPSADSVEKNGLDLGDNQATLLKKIEELTMYMIDLNKEVQKLKEENTALKKKVASIRKK